MHKYENRFHIELGEASVVSQASENVGWGYYQFPDMSYTKDGSVWVGWQMRNDDWESLSKGDGEAISDDLGVTWRPRRESDVITSGVRLPNGKAFKGFQTRYVLTCEAMKNYTPVLEHKGRRYHFLEDIKEYDDRVEGVERDLESGCESRFDITLKWKNLALVEFADQKIMPTAYLMGVCGAAPKILELSDGLYFATYHWSFDIHAEKREDAIRPEFLELSVFVFRSTDGARTWECISQIAPDEDIVRSGSGFEGLDEPQMELMEDGSVVMLMRSGTPHKEGELYPSYISRSLDNCRTWSKPKQFADRGVLPQILRLGCGVTLASYGRPGLFVRATDDVSGQEWQEPVEVELSVATGKCWGDSCCYTRMIPIDDYSALMVYSDFNYPDRSDGKPKKSIIVRKITVVTDNQ